MCISRRTYTVAIAGMGKRGTHHADAFVNNPRFHLVGLCDTDPQRLETAVKTFGESMRALMSRRCSPTPGLTFLHSARCRKSDSPISRPVLKPA